MIVIDHWLIDAIHHASKSRDPPTIQGLSDLAPLSVPLFYDIVFRQVGKWVVVGAFGIPGRNLLESHWMSSCFFPKYGGGKLC